MPFTNSYIYNAFVDTRPVPTRTLDRVNPKPAVCYGLTLLSSTYTGSCITVQRTSDNFQLNVGFNSDGNIDSNALIAFANGGNLTVAIWYDQSGNNKHLTSTNQAIIVTNGIIALQNNKPTINFTNNNTYFVANPLSNLNELDIYSVYTETARQQTSFFDLTNNGTLRGLCHAPWSDGVLYFDIGDITIDGRVNVTSPLPLGTCGLLRFNHSVNNNSKSIAVNNNILVTGSKTNNVPVTDRLQIGFNSSIIGNGFTGNLSEFIIYNTTLLPFERLALSNDIRGRFLI